MLEIQASGHLPAEHRDLEQSMAVQLETAAQGWKEETQISIPHSPCCHPSPLGAHALSEQQEEAETGPHSTATGKQQGAALAGELELSQLDEAEDQELSKEESNKCQVSQGKAYAEPEMTRADAGCYKEISKGKPTWSRSWPQGNAERITSYRRYTFWSIRMYPEGKPAVRQSFPQERTVSIQKFSKGKPTVSKSTPQKDAASYLEESKGESCSEPEVSQENAGHYQEMSQGESCSEPETSQGAAGSY